MLRFSCVLWLLTGLFSGLRGQVSWSAELPGLGTFSSPRIADLNGDGTGDVILGAGREEFQACDSAVIALDGRTGALLWTGSAKDQIFGSAALSDVSGDGVPDVFINGRSAELQAIDGRSGEVLWKFLAPDRMAKWEKKSWFNFYNPQFIPDQDGDGREDLLVSNGGDVMVEPYDPNRPAGYLAVLSSRDGRLLARAPMPDGRETYMSVAALPATDGDYRIIFGTGGETVGGSLFVGRLSEVLAGDLSGAVRLDSSAHKGFIGPPVWADITDDGVSDIVANAVDGRLLAYDGATYERIWQASMPNTEAYSSIAPGYFNTDTVPDFFVSYAQGVWPKLDWTRQYMVDGASGAIQFADSLGYYQTSTPVVADLTGDGTDDALLVVNYHVTDELYQKWFYNMLVAVDFKAGEVIELGVNYEGHNLSSTPWIGDMDGDGLLDIIICHGTNARHTYTFDGMRVERLATTIPVRGKLRWGAYMGSDYDGVFKK